MIGSPRAFQRLGFAFEILKSQSSRHAYDKASKPSLSQLPDKTAFLGGEHTFRSAVAAVLHEFIAGDFAMIRGWLRSLHRRYPHIVSQEALIGIEHSFTRIQELVLTTRTYGLLIYIELGRIRRVQKQLLGLGYLDILGKARLSLYLVRVTLAVPMRVDRALKAREEKAWRARTAGLQATGSQDPVVLDKAGILNDRVSRVLEFIVGAAGNDEGADEAWSAKMAKSTST